MLNKAQRTTILELNAQGVSKREITRILGISRATVRQVLRSNSAEVPELDRPEKAEPYRQQILELLITCKGNLVRVHEELTASGAALSYPALTAFRRRQGIGQPPGPGGAPPASRRHFEPGQELQHDTSPHEIEMGGRKRKVQTASAVLRYSRMLFFQIYPCFQRFDCKLFLTDALRYAGGAPQHVMIDNTHVVVLRGTGRVERLHLKPLPAWIPEVCRLHHRRVGVEGYVSVNTNRYSSPTRASSSPSSSGSRWPNTARRAGKAASAANPIRKNRPFWRPRPSWLTISPLSNNGAASWSALPCANC